MSNGTPEHSLTYGYDASGRLSTTTSPAGTFTYAYTPNSSLIATVTPDPVGAGGPVHTVTNFWETHRNVLDIKENKIPSTTTTISSFNYGVNAIGQRTGVTTTGTAFPSQPADWTWGYDALGQIIRADSPTNTHDRAYEYDQIGNRKKSADGALVTTGTTATTYDANSLNQYSQISVPSVQSVVPIHDQDGNATSYPVPVAPTTNASLIYDGENRLTSVTTGATTVGYVYDSQSRRVASVHNGNVTLYLYDAWNCLAEYTLHTSSFNLHTSLTWGIDLSGSLQGAGGVGGLLAVNLLSSVSGSSVFFPTFDGNGNISEYLTASGSIAAHYEYDPFGRTIVATGSQAADFSYRFSTKPVDPATGLYYYGYRWYDAHPGRWINRDPIEEEGGINLYEFVGNESVNTIDELGLSTAQLSEHQWAIIQCPQMIPSWDINDKDSAYQYGQERRQQIPQREEAACRRKIIEAAGLVSEWLRKSPCKDAFLATQNVTNIDLLIQRLSRIIVFDGADCKIKELTCIKCVRWVDEQGANQFAFARATSDFAVQGYTKPNDGRWRIHVCPSLCQRAASEIAKTIVHELYHEADNGASGEAGAIIVEGICGAN